MLRWFESTHLDQNIITMERKDFEEEVLDYANNRKPKS